MLWSHSGGWRCGPAGALVQPYRRYMDDRNSSVQTAPRRQKIRHLLLYQNCSYAYLLYRLRIADFYCVRSGGLVVVAPLTASSVRYTYSPFGTNKWPIYTINWINNCNTHYVQCWTQKIALVSPKCGKYCTKLPQFDTQNDLVWESPPHATVPTPHTNEAFKIQITPQH